MSLDPSYEQRLRRCCNGCGRTRLTTRHGRLRLCNDCLAAEVAGGSPNRTEAQLRAYYGTHPPTGQRCTDDECVQCETRDLFATIDRLREHLAVACTAYDQVTTVRNLLEPVCEADEQALAKLNAIIEEARAASREAS